MAGASGGSITNGGVAQLDRQGLGLLGRTVAEVDPRVGKMAGGDPRGLEPRLLEPNPG